MKTYLPECLHIHKLEVEPRASGNDASVGRCPNYFTKWVIVFLWSFSPALTTYHFISEITHWLMKIASRSHTQKTKDRNVYENKLENKHR